MHLKTDQTACEPALKYIQDTMLVVSTGLLRLLEFAELRRQVIEKAAEISRNTELQECSGTVTDAQNSLSGGVHFAGSQFALELERCIDELAVDDEFFAVAQRGQSVLDREQLRRRAEIEMKAQDRKAAKRLATQDGRERTTIEKSEAPAAKVQRPRKLPEPGTVVEPVPPPMDPDTFGTGAVRKKNNNPFSLENLFNTQ